MATRRVKLGLGFVELDEQDRVVSLELGELTFGQTNPENRPEYEPSEETAPGTPERQ